MDTSIVPHKQCQHKDECVNPLGHWLPVTEFHRDRQKPDGYYSYCKACVRLYQQQRLANNGGHVRALAKATRDRSKDDLNARKRARYADDPTPFRLVNKRSRLKNAINNRQKDRDRYPNEKDSRNESQKRYYAQNKHVFQAATTRRLARERGLPNDFSKDDWQRALEYFDNCCAVCDRPAGLWHKLAADHWIPLSSPNCPGTAPQNIIPLCHGLDGCNNSKKDSDAEYWLKWKFGEHKAQKVLKRVGEYFHWVNRRHNNCADQ